MWMDMKYRFRDFQDAIRRLGLDVRLACIALKVDPEPITGFVGRARRQLEVFDS